MFSNPNSSKPRLSPAATMSDATPSALTPPLRCASILQPATPPQVTTIFNLRPSLLQFVSIVSLWLNHGNLIYEHVCVVLTFSSSAFAFLIEMNFSFKSLFSNLVVFTTAIPLLLFP